MADTKIVGGKGLVREEHEHKRDCDCKVHVDHKTLAGNGTKEHPLEVIALPGSQPFTDPLITAREAMSARRLPIIWIS